MNQFQKADNEPAFDEFIYQKREEQWTHMPYEKELIILDMIKNGDVNSLMIYPWKNIFAKYSHLSDNPLRQKKYEFVASITNITRMAVESGLDMETAYTLSDSYIRFIDKIDDMEKLLAVFKKMPIDYATRIKNINKMSSLSRLVLLCMDYIENNLHYEISLNDLAKHTQKTPHYLSALFKKEVGKSVKAYITSRRLEEAKRMLAHTTLPISEIATTLAFNSQSYFIFVFRENCHETPRQYRNRYFRTRKR